MANFFNLLTKRSLPTAFTLSLVVLVGGVAGCSSEFSLPSQMAGGNQDAYQDSYLDSEKVYVRLPAKFIDKSFVEQTGFIRDHKGSETVAFGYLERQDLMDLPDYIHSQIVELDESWIHYDFDPMTLAFKNGFNTFQQDYSEGYHDYVKLTEELERLAAEHADIMSLHSAGQSVEGRELWYMKVTRDPKADHAQLRPKLLYVANMHGDEVVGRELMIYLLRLFGEQHQSNERISQLVDHAQIFIMPSMNPDGFEGRQRWNRRGKDLNRDFPDFTSDPLDSKDGRQPETQAIMSLHEEHHFIGALNFHGGAVCFNMPWDTHSNADASGRFGDDSLMQQYARIYADSNESMRTNSSSRFDRGVTYGYEWYEVDGGMQDWANYYRQSFHATIELSSIKWPSGQTLGAFWRENREGLITYLEQMLHGFHFEVRDAETNQRLELPVRISNSGASRVVEYQNGVIHRPANGGSQDILIEADGYQSLELELQQPWAFEGELTPVLLRR